MNNTKFRIFLSNERGKIELSKQELESLLTDTYNEGYYDCYNCNKRYNIDLVSEKERLNTLSTHCEDIDNEYKILFEDDGK